MEERVGVQYAVQIAMHTLKERCRQLQQRVSLLEEENVILRIENGREADKSFSPTERALFTEQITELTEQKQQLQNKVKMVTTENQELWKKLSQLNQVNLNLESQLNKINESLVQHDLKNKEGHSPLIRSKTFTQDEPHTRVLQRNLEENNKISSELEEISLKIINSLAQGKNELESFCSEIGELNVNDANNITNSFGFYYDDFDSNLMDEFSGMAEELKATKQVVLQQHSLLQKLFEKVANLKETSKADNCDRNVPEKKETVDRSTSTPRHSEVEASTQAAAVTPEPQVPVGEFNWEMICPFCCKSYPKGSDYAVFCQHVERHMIANEYEML